MSQIASTYIRCQCLVHLYREDLTNHDTMTTRITRIKMLAQVLFSLTGIVLFFVDTTLNLELLYSGMMMCLAGVDGYMEKRERKFDRDGRNKTLTELTSIEKRLETGGDETVVLEYGQCENARTSFSRSVVKRKMKEWKERGIAFIPKFLDTETINTIGRDNLDADEVIDASNQMLEEV